MLSQRPEDFEKVVENPQLAVAMERLTPRQKDVVFQTFMKERTPQEIAERLNTTDRNVRDVLARAIANLKKTLTDKSGEGTIDTVAIVLFWMVLPTFAISWAVTKRMYPKLKQMITGKAA